MISSATPLHGVSLDLIPAIILFVKCYLNRLILLSSIFFSQSQRSMTVAGRNGLMIFKMLNFEQYLRKTGQR